MLTTFLTAHPLPKLIIIEDDFQQQGVKIHEYIVNKLSGNVSDVKFCQFSFRGFNKTFNEYETNKFIAYNTTINDVKKIIASCHQTLLVIDSLTHMIYKFGLLDTYDLLNSAKDSLGIIQIVILFHSDLMKDEDCIGHFQYLSNLYIKMEHPFQGKPRLSYTYKKTRGKVIHEFEQYKFEDNILKMMPIDKIDPKTIVRQNIVSPDSLTTFKIELNDNDKLSRSQFSLPYLPSELQKDKSTNIGGQIHYDLDEGDDWDAEDPDDDLDI